MSCKKSLNPNIKVSAINTKRTNNPVSAKVLAERWGVREEKARTTLDVTTQKRLRHVKHPVEHRTSKPHLRKQRLNGPFCSNTLFVTEKSIRGYTHVPKWPLMARALEHSGQWTARSVTSANKPYFWTNPRKRRRRQSHRVRWRV